MRAKKQKRFGTGSVAVLCIPTPGDNRLTYDDADVGGGGGWNNDGNPPPDNGGGGAIIGKGNPCIMCKEGPIAASRRAEKFTKNVERRTKMKIEMIEKIVEIVVERTAPMIARAAKSTTGATARTIIAAGRRRRLTFFHAIETVSIDEKFRNFKLFGSGCKISTDTHFCTTSFAFREKNFKTKALDSGEILLMLKQEVDDLLR
uniref:Uncharacterized protein n=1 Tax=Romanomermis culicivorax TaxID=13658 RepID=A0A915L951_ROMCU